MPNVSDLYTTRAIVPLMIGDQKIGTLIARCTVHQYVDLHDLSASPSPSYLVEATQRLIIPNQSTFQMMPGPVSSFSNYPALVSNQLELLQGDGSQAPDFSLLDYSPKTLNATVESSLSASATAGTSYSRQQTRGSSTSATNTFGASASVGFQGEMPTGDLSGNYSHSTTTESNKSTSWGSQTNRERQAASSDSMSIKDWGSYAMVDPGYQSLSWLWGQEYPWNVIWFRNTDQNSHIVLPDFVKQRLFDGTQVYPPSELSQFGIDFVSKASWRVALAPDATTISLQHTLQYCVATHAVQGTAVTASMTDLTPDPDQPLRYTTLPIDLPLLALDPITTLNAGNGAVIGFFADRFSTGPSSGMPFSICSEANNLLVRGQGFSQPMIADLTTGSAELHLSFKITDTVNEYSLFIKHWKLNDEGCVLSVNINGRHTLTKHVDAVEEDGGDNNLTVIGLRNKDYSSVDYHDYLQLGLNTIDITIRASSDTPTSATCGYALHAVAIG